MGVTYRDLVIASSPVSFYRLDEERTDLATAWRDLVGGWTLTNTVVEACQAYHNLNTFSQALYASAATGGLYRGETSRFNWNYNQAFSFHFWFVGRGLTPAGQVAFFGKRSSSSTLLGYAFFATDTVLSWQMANNAGTGVHFRRDYALPSTVWEAGRWTHLAVTYDGSGNRSGLKVYIDGDLQTPTADSGAASIAASTTAGEYFTIQFLSRNSTENSFMGTNGAFADFAIYNRELTDVEVASFGDFIWEPSCRNANLDEGLVRSVSRPAKNLRNLSTGVGTRKKKRRKVNPGVN